MLNEWFGAEWPHIHAIVENPLQWFMRAYVATQYGQEVEEMAWPAQKTTQDKLRYRMTQWLEFMRR